MSLVNLYFEKCNNKKWLMTNYHYFIQSNRNILFKCCSSINRRWKKSLFLLLNRCWRKIVSVQSSSCPHGHLEAAIDCSVNRISGTHAAAHTPLWRGEPQFTGVWGCSAEVHGTVRVWILRRLSLHVQIIHGGGWGACMICQSLVPQLSQWWLLQQQRQW